MSVFCNCWIVAVIFSLISLSAKLHPQDVLRTYLKKGLDVLRTSSYGAICNAKGHICSGAFLGHTQDVNLTIIHEVVFYGIFSSFLILTVYQTLHCQSKLKTWCVLFWSDYGPGRLYQNRTIRGRPQDVVCRLGWIQLQ